MPDPRYSIQRHYMLRSHSNADNTNLAANVRYLLYLYGFGYVWETNTIGDDIILVDAFRQRIKDCVIQQLHSQIKDSPKPMPYKSFKVIFEAEIYLKIDLPFCIEKY